MARQQLFSHLHASRRFSTKELPLGKSTISSPDTVTQSQQPSNCTRYCQLPPLYLTSVTWDKESRSPPSSR